MYQTKGRWGQMAKVLSALIFALALCVLAPRSGYAQQTPPVPEGQTSAPSQPGQVTPPPSAQSGQVQGYTLSPAQEAQAIAYARARHELYFLDVAYGLLLLVLLLQLRVAPVFRNWAERAVESRFAQIVVFVALLLLTIDVLELPPGLYQQHLGRRYGPSVQG